MERRRSHTAVALLALAAGASVAALAGSGAAAVRAASPPASASPPVISGTARQGDTLTASSGSWGGTTPIAYAYQWQRCSSSGASCSAVAGATGTTYALAAADVGKTIRVQVTATNSAGSAAATSAPAGPVAPPGSAPAPTTQPTPTGTAQVGDTVTVSSGTWSGTEPIAFAYQWQRCTATNPTCQDISGAAHQSYTVGAGDVGMKL